jgi:hypothetical protein
MVFADQGKAETLRFPENIVLRYSLAEEEPYNETYQKRERGDSAK